MVNSKTIPAASQSATSHSDWYTFLRSAFINGLKAYGASLMTVAVAPYRLPLETWETSTTLSELAIDAAQVSKPLPSPALPLTSLAKSAGFPIHRAPSPLDGRQTIKSEAPLSAAWRQA